jgi:hypothetical protein
VFLVDAKGDWAEVSDARQSIGEDREMRMGLMGGLAVLLLATGCVSYSMGVPSNEKEQAYVIKTRRTPFSTQDRILLCNASGGNPVCVHQAER